MGCDLSSCNQAPETGISEVVTKIQENKSFIHDRSTNLSYYSLTPRELESKPFVCLLPLIQNLFQEFENFNEIFGISQIWVHELMFFLNYLGIGPENIRTTLNLESKGTSLLIKHEVDGISNFDFIKFVSSKFFLIFQKQPKNLKIIEKTFFSLNSLSTVFYLQLGSNIDFGFGIEKIIDINHLQQIIPQSEDVEKIIQWSNKNNQPIITAAWISAVEDVKAVNFYIFDGFKRQNVEKALAMFEMFGPAIDRKVAEVLASGKCDDVNCCVWIDDGKVKRINLEVQREPVSLEEVAASGFHVDQVKWQEFMARGMFRGLGLESNPNGYFLSQVVLY